MNLGQDGVVCVREHLRDDLEGPVKGQTLAVLLLLVHQDAEKPGKRAGMSAGAAHAVEKHEKTYSTMARVGWVL